MKQEPERPKYTKDLDIGRIAISKEQVKPKCSNLTLAGHKAEYSKNLHLRRTEIKETFEEKNLLKVHGKEKTIVDPIEVTLTRQELEEIATTKEDIVKVGKLDVACLEKQIMKSTKESTYAYATHKVIITC